MRHYGLDVIPFNRDSRPDKSEQLRLCGYREIHGEFGPEVMYWRDLQEKFRWEAPQSFEDAEGGGYCSKTGIWFPARRIVDKGGVKTGDVFSTEEPDA